MLVNIKHNDITEPDKPEMIKNIENFINLVGDEMSKNYPLPINNVNNKVVVIGNDITTNNILGYKLWYKLNHCCNC